ncbi:MAG: alpha/beta hydrolase [Planctomycetes bacterium]|nr:alpha/beta hydrolase [Planctomycetota bacterium]
MTGLSLLLCALCVHSPGKVTGAEYLWPGGVAPGAVGKARADKPPLTVHLAKGRSATGCGVIVCPGGGYFMLADNHEGKQIAAWLNSFGVSAFVLRYRHAPRYHHPAPLQDAQRAIRLVRSRAKKGRVDPNRIGIIGFSAGGHLASSTGTHFDKGNPEAKDPVDKESCRPDFMILGYPVISFTEPFTHVGSRNNFVGGNPALAELFSNEKQVTAQTPPTFLLHTTEDRVVPPQNSIVFYMALLKAGVPAELHIYEKGPPGVGLAKKRPGISGWPASCQAWLGERGFLKKKR